MSHEYTAPDGNLYQSPDREIEHKQNCVENATEYIDSYRRGWKYLGQPSAAYLALRAVGVMLGFGEINPEVEGVLGTLDLVASGGFILGGVSKLVEWLAILDLRGAKKNLQESIRRLGFEDKTPPM